MERLIRNERKREVVNVLDDVLAERQEKLDAKIVAVVNREFDSAIERKVGQMAVQYAPWALIPAGGAAGVAWSKRRNGKAAKG